MRRLCARSCRGPRRAEEHEAGLVRQHRGMDVDEQAVARAVQGFWSLGARVRELRGGAVLRNDAAPDHPLGNFLFRVRARSEAELDALLVQAAPCRRIVLDRETPSVVEARLVLDDWTPDRVLQLVLPRSAAVPAPAERPRRVDDADWQAVLDLFRIDHLEEDERMQRTPRSVDETRSAVLLRRSLGPSVDYFLAGAYGRAIGCIAVGVGDDGIALIEDVFVHPDERGRGVATEMLRFAVQHARSRGAGPVIIGADADDTPKRLYARLGFRPTSVVRSYSG